MSAKEKIQIQLSDFAEYILQTRLIANQASVGAFRSEKGNQFFRTGISCQSLMDCQEFLSLQNLSCTNT